MQPYENFQNISVICIGLLSIAACWYYNQSDAYQIFNINKYLPFDILLPIVGVHALIDFFITDKLEIKFHHLFVFGVLFYNYYYRVANQVQIYLTYPLMKTEISSIFLCLKSYIPKNSVWYTVNSVIFYACFFKLRIIDFYSQIIYNHESLNLTFHTYSQGNPLLTAILFSSCYGLYILNIYWFYIINKILYKGLTKLFEGFNTDQMCQLLCSYIHIVNIPLAVYIYSQKPNEKYLFDMLGITGLSITSYLYHYDVYKRLFQKQITEYVMPDHITSTLFLYDTAFIRIRSFLTVFTNFYSHEHFIPFVLVSGIVHSTTYFCTIIHLLQGKMTKIEDKSSAVVVMKSKNRYEMDFVSVVNLLSMLPVSVDILFIFLNSPVEFGIPFMTVNIAMALLFVVEPFYKLNHVAFHVLLVAQNYYLCLSHRGL